LNPYNDISNVSLAKALAHPLRARILAALEERTASPSELAAELDASLGVVSYHVRRLVALGFVEPVRRVARRGAVEHYYTTITRPRITDATWAATPVLVKQATIRAALEQVSSYVNEAAGVGGFDAEETHLTRSPLTVDAQGFTALARELEALTARIQVIEDESKQRLARADHVGTQNATVVLMLFQSRRPTAKVATPLRAADSVRDEKSRSLNR
jgi:DNA-binding transcriptional ArsR family regulator